MNCAPVFMKLACTISDFGGAMHVPGVPSADNRTYIIDVPDDSLPKDLRERVAEVQEGRFNYSCLSFSIVIEPKPKES